MVPFCGDGRPSGHVDDCLRDGLVVGVDAAVADDIVGGHVGDWLSVSHERATGSSDRTKRTHPIVVWGTNPSEMTLRHAVHIGLLPEVKIPHECRRHERYSGELLTWKMVCASAGLASTEMAARQAKPFMMLTRR